MKYFEYRTLRVEESMRQHFSIVDWLNDLGKEGWELCLVRLELFYFKREVE